MAAQKYSIFSSFKAVDGMSKFFIKAGNKATYFKKKTVGAFKTASKSGSLFGAVLGGNLVAGAITAVKRQTVDWLKTSISLFDKQNEAIKNVQAGLVSTGGIAGKTLDGLTKQAVELQKKTFFGDELILQNATAQILTFTNITGDSFDRTQKAVLDVAAKLKGLDANAETVRATSIMLGKALNDPVANLGALGRVGIQFNKTQKDQIKKLAKSGKMFKAQTIILSELERQYGGTAAALAKTSGGMAKQIQNMTGDFKEMIGGALSPLRLEFLKLIMNVLPLLVPIIEKVSNQIKHFTDKNKDLIKVKFVLFIKSGIYYLSIFIKLIKKIYPVIKKLIPLFIAWQAAILLVNLGLKGMALLGMIGQFLKFVRIVMMVVKAKGIWAAAQWALNVALNANPIGLITIGIFALIAAITLLVIHWEKVKKILKSVWVWFKKVYDVLLLFLGPIGIQINAIINLIKHIGEIKKAFSEGGILAAIKAIGQIILDSIIDPMQKVIAVMKQLPSIMSRIPGIKNIFGKSDEASKVVSPNQAKEEAKVSIFEKLKGKIVVGTQGNATADISDNSSGLLQMDPSLLGAN